MNIETTRMAMIKRAADMAGLAKSVAQTANPSKNINAANAGYAIGKALAPARNTQTAAPAPVATPAAPTAPAAPAAPANPAPAQAKGPLQRILEAGRAAYQNGQASGQKINDYAKANPLLDWNNGTREHLGDTYTENLRRLANAWDKGVRIGEDTAAANEPQAKAIDQALGQIRQDPSTVVQDAQNAERAGVFSKGLNNLIKYLSERKATAPAAPTSVPTTTAPSSEAGSTEIIQ